MTGRVGVGQSGGGTCSGGCCTSTTERQRSPGSSGGRCFRTIQEVARRLLGRQRDGPPERRLRVLAQPKFHVGAPELHVGLRVTRPLLEHAQLAAGRPYAGQVLCGQSVGRATGRQFQFALGAVPVVPLG